MEVAHSILLHGLAGLLAGAILAWVVLSSL